MNFNHIKTLIIKEWMELRRSNNALLPMLILPVVFVVILPLIMILTSSQPETSQQMQQTLKAFPASALPQGLTVMQQGLYIELNYLLSPMFLIIPVMVASIIAANSFAGEKERRTIEGLLYTPLTDKELILGKIASSFIPAVLLGILSFVAYSILVDILVYPIFHYLLLPNLTWLILIFWLSPALSFIAFSVVVLLSQKAKSVWEAQQSAAFMVLPIIALLASQATGFLILSPIIVAFVGLVFLIIDIFLYRWLATHLNRERLVNNYA